MFSRLSLAAGALGGALLAFGAFQLINASLWLPAAREEGRLIERAELDSATNKAIGELRDAADRARFNRRLCIERGRLYVNATGQCVERTAQPGG
ncbi:hypothetical protein ABIA16_001771 [Sinorhizobium fredii]